MSEVLTAETLDTLRIFLREQSTLALATVNSMGQPQAAPIFYVSDDDLCLYWLSSAKSRHSVNLNEQPQVSATVYPAVWGWQEIRGVQIDGRARAIIDPAEREMAIGLYKAKFTLPPTFDAQIAASVMYVLEPSWLRWLDNSVRFGFKAEGQI